MNGAQLLADAFRSSGVQVVFGTPGETTLPWYAAAADCEVTHVMARCERCAGYMADVYGRLTNTVAGCDAPGGIGSPHLLPALHEAHNSSTPMIVLTSATPEHLRGTWATSECEHTDMFRPTVKAVIETRAADRLPQSVQRAVDLAVGGRPGPVHLDVGSDVLAKSVDCEQHSLRANASFPSHRPRPSTLDVSRCVDLLRNCQRPLIVAGGGTQLSNASDSLERFADVAQVPVATTFNGKGAIAEVHDLSVGVVGAKGSLEANSLASQADLIIWLGSKGGDKSTNYRQIPGASARSIQVDIDPGELSNTLNPTTAVCADIAAFCEDMTAALEGHDINFASWLEQTRNSSTAWPVAGRDDVFDMATVIARLNDELSDDAVIVADASRACSWVGALFRTSKSGRSVVAPRGSGSIGFALPGAIAAAVARPSATVIGIGGDGGLGMSVHEMETARRLGLAPIFILLNDGAFGLLNEVSSVTMDRPELLGHFAFTHWGKVAEGFGWASVRVTSNGEALEGLRAAVANARAGVPTLIDMALGTEHQSPDVSLFRQRHQGPF